MNEDTPIGFDETPLEDDVPETAGADWERGLVRGEMGVNADERDARNSYGKV